MFIIFCLIIIFVYRNKILIDDDDVDLKAHLPRSYFQTTKGISFGAFFGVFFGALGPPEYIY